MRKHSNVYYIKAGEDYSPCKNATGIRNDFGADLFRYRGLIYEGSTGVHICGENRFAEFAERFSGKPEQFAEVLRKHIAAHGLSPRYTQPDVKKADLFPPDDRRKLAKTLDQKERCWFKRLDFPNGPEMYVMEKEFLRNGFNSMPYAPCNGWMIPYSAFKDVADRRTEPDFHLYEYLNAKFEQSLIDPDNMADDSLAEFLGRQGDADAHNLPIRQAALTTPKPSVLGSLEDNKQAIAAQGRASPPSKKEQPDL